MDRRGNSWQQGSTWASVGARSCAMDGHCLTEFGKALTEQTAISQLVWAHARAPEGAREIAMKYVVANCGSIQVGCVWQECWERGSCLAGTGWRAAVLPGVCSPASAGVIVIRGNAGHTMVLVAALPSDVAVKLFAAHQRSCSSRSPCIVFVLAASSGLAQSCNFAGSQELGKWRK